MAMKTLEERLARIEAALDSLNGHFETRLSAVAHELRRAEARDEWGAAHIRDVKRQLRKQDRRLADIKKELAHASGGARPEP